MSHPAYLLAHQQLYSIDSDVTVINFLKYTNINSCKINLINFICITSTALHFTRLLKITHGESFYRERHQHILKCLLSQQKITNAFCTLSLAFISAHYLSLIIFCMDLSYLQHRNQTMINSKMYLCGQINFTTLVVEFITNRAFNNQTFNKINR